MIPKIIHYCWFGRGEMPALVQECINSWHKFMPDWEYRLWNEDNYDIASAPAYVQETYEARKFAFVSDYVRLWALEQFGGLYLDTDVEVFKPFDDLMDRYNAFAGFEGSKHLPIGTCVLASKADGEWVNEMLAAYADRHFIKTTNYQAPEYDMIANTAFISAIMSANGFMQNGEEQNYKDLHVLPVDYFSPMSSTSELRMTPNTYCIHHFAGSWQEYSMWQKVKNFIRFHIIGNNLTIRIVHLKRKLVRLVR